jgi:hypothetical protein
MPETWQWIFSIIGLVAFLMAFPFILQLVFGQPMIGLRFIHDDSGGEGRVIKVCLMNIPVNNILLKALRVSRLPAQDVYLTVEVYNASNREPIAQLLPEISSSRFTKVDRISLPPSILMTNVTLVKWQRSNNSAVLVGTFHPIPLKEGDYEFVIRIGSDGNTKICKPATLHIGKTEIEMCWDKSVTDRILV